MNRRELLGTTAAGFAVALAGCGVFADGRGVPGRTEPRDENGNGSDGIPEGMPEDVHNWLLDTKSAQIYSNDPELVDQRGQDGITIAVGAGAQNLAFDPPAVHVDVGTEVTWEWTGRGGPHNVSTEFDDDISKDFEFRSGEAIPDAGHTWSNTFDEAGRALYICEPHESAGMVGVVIVGDVVTGGDEMDDGEEDGDGNETESDGE